MILSIAFINGMKMIPICLASIEKNWFNLDSVRVIKLNTIDSILCSAFVFLLVHQTYGVGVGPLLRLEGVIAFILYELNLLVIKAFSLMFAITFGFY